MKSILCVLLFEKWIFHITNSLSQVKDITGIIWNNDTGFKYDKKSYDNDYIILKLGSPLQFNENVRPACLPSSSSFLGLDSTKTSCFTSGWGKLNFSKLYLTASSINSINVHCSCFSRQNISVVCISMWIYDKWY